MDTSLALPRAARSRRVPQKWADTRVWFNVLEIIFLFLFFYHYDLLSIIGRSYFYSTSCPNILDEL